MTTTDLNIDTYRHQATIGLVETAAKSAWQVAFLVRDFPDELCTLGPAHVTCRPDKDFMDQLCKCGEPSVFNFLGQHKHARFIWAGFAIDAESRLDAISEAQHRIEGLVDGASFWGDNKFPEISDFVWVGPVNDPDLQIVHFHRQIWIEMLNTAPESQAS